MEQQHRRDGGDGEWTDEPARFAGKRDQRGDREREFQLHSGDVWGGAALLADAEGGEDAVEDVVGGGGAGEGVERS